MKEFKDRYRDIDGVSPSMLAEMASFITGDKSCGSHGEVDKRMKQRIQLWLSQSCPEDADDIVVDLRRLNKSKTIYDDW